MKYGFTATSFRQIRELEKIVDIAVKANADIIEWGGDRHVTDLSAAKRAKSLCDGAGIAVSSYGSYYRVGSGNHDQWQRICEMAAAMNCESVRVWLGTADSQKTDEAQYRRILEDTVFMCETAKPLGLQVCPECHDKTFNNNTDAFLRIYREAGCDNLKTYFQSRYRKKAYDLDRIERTLPHIANVHISFSEQNREQFPRFDKTYIDALIQKLVASGYDGNMLLEYTYLFSYAGIPAMMIKDLNKLREKVREAK